MKRHRSRLFTIPLRFILSIVFLLSVVEMVGRYEMNHDNRYVTLLLQPIPAYQNAPFWSQAFQTDLSSRKLSCNYQDGYVYHSQYFNVDHCIRRIVGQPTNVSRRIWLFGSSTLYTGELPDDWTIASQLQALLPNWRIEQRTSSGAPVLVMLTMLREQDIRAGDIVIFYDGWTDSVNAFQNAQQLALPPNPACKLLDPFFGAWHMLCDWTNTYVDPHALSPEILNPVTAEMVRHYKSALAQARLWTEKHGARFVNVLGPHMWSQPLSNEEKQIEANPVLTFPAVGKFIPTLYAALRTADPQAVDLTHELDEVRLSDPVYLDSDHIGWRGIPIIARALAQVVNKAEF